jgi:hypothetical protein
MIIIPVITIFFGIWFWHIVNTYWNLKIIELRYLDIFNFILYTKLYTLNNSVCCKLGMSDGNNFLPKLLGSKLLLVPFQLVVSSFEILSSSKKK